MKRLFILAAAAAVIAVAAGAGGAARSAQPTAQGSLAPQVLQAPGGPVAVQQRWHRASGWSGCTAAGGNLHCYLPSDIREAYGIDQLPEKGDGQTVVLIDAYGSPAAADELQTFHDAFFASEPEPNFDQVFPLGRPDYKNANGNGQSGPSAAAGWAVEAALDVQWSYAIAPHAHIVLMAVPPAETLGVQGFPNLFKAINQAIDTYPAGTVFSMSLATTESAFGGAAATQTSKFDAVFLANVSGVSKITGPTLSIGERVQVTTGSIVSANYFDAIGVHPILGRGFEPGEDTGRNAHAVVVISYHLWQTRFKGDLEIIGKTQRLDNVVYTIIGVAPMGFYGTFVGRGMEFWVPASMLEAFGDDKRDRLADKPDAALRQPQMAAREHRRPVGALALKRHAHDAEPRRDKIVAGQHEKDSGRRLRSAQVEPADLGMGMRRAQDIGVGLARQVDVVLKAAIAREQPLVLKALDRLPDPELAHMLYLRLSLRGARRQSNLTDRRAGSREIALLRWQ